MQASHLVLKAPAAIAGYIGSALDSNPKFDPIHRRSRQPWELSRAVLEFKLFGFTSLSEVQQLLACHWQKFC